MGNNKVGLGKKIWHFIKWVTVGSKLFWLCVGVPIGFLLIGCFFNYPLLIMAYGVQISAFFFFIRRINILLETDNDYSGIKGLLKLWWEKRKIKKALSGNVSVGSSADAACLTGNEEPPKNKSIHERVTWLEEKVGKLQDIFNQRLNDLKSKLDDQIKDLKIQIKEIKEEKAKEKKDIEVKQRDTYSYELVAVLWLIFAALIHAYMTISG